MHSQKIADKSIQIVHQFCRSKCSGGCTMMQLPKDTAETVNSGKLFQQENAGNLNKKKQQNKTSKKLVI